jgi:hypothetical protein
MKKKILPIAITAVISFMIFAAITLPTSTSAIETSARTPVIIPHEIAFNWGPGSDAITMYDSCTKQPLVTPEFVYPKRNNPAAYVRGNYITVAVKFRARPEVSSAGIGAIGSFGGFRPKLVTFKDGESDWIKFTTHEPMPDSIMVHDVAWTWGYKIDAASPWTKIGTSHHTIYAVNKKPITSPVYKELVEWTTEWCTGLPDDEKQIADAIIEGFNSTGVIKYGAAGWDTAEILCTGDGMCGGMKEVFYDACGTQGIHVARFCYLLYDADPGPQELWDGIVCQAPGLGRDEPTFSPRTCRWVDSVYPCPLYLGDPSLDDDVEVETKRVYTFYGPDGHCINLLDYSGEIYLYDLSFGTGPWADTFDSIPTTGYYQGAALRDFRANYHDYAVDHMYGKIYYDDGTGCGKLDTRFDVKSLIIPDSIGTQDQIKYYFSVTRDKGEGMDRARTTERTTQPLEVVIAMQDKDASTKAIEKVKALLQDEDEAVNWVSVRNAILQLGELKDKSCEEYLVQLLAREKELTLTPDSPLPGAMPPLEILKAAAICTLKEIDARDSIQAIEAVYYTTENQALRDIARDTIEALGGEVE